VATLSWLRLLYVLTREWCEPVGLRQAALFLISYACVVGLVIWAVFAVTETPPPSQLRCEWKNEIAPIDEDAIKEEMRLPAASA
jgi:hypothetical protein